MEREIKKVPKEPEFEEVVEITLSSGDIREAIRKVFDIPKNASIELTGETYDADPWNSSPFRAGDLQVRGTGAVVSYKKED